MNLFNFKNDYILENEYAKLIPLKVSDFENLLEFSVNEPEIWQYSMVKADNPENLKKYISLALDEREKFNEYPFIIFDKTKQKFVGATRFCDIHINTNRLQMGYTWFGKNFQGTGINKHCKFLMLQFAFEEMGMERVEFRAYTENIRSINALKSIGCTIEGVIRSNAICPIGKRRDTMVLSILKQEWTSTVKQMLNSKLTIPVL